MKGVNGIDLRALGASPLQKDIFVEIARLRSAYQAADGRQIVYTGGAWGQNHFYVIPAAGGAPRRVTRGSRKWA